MCPHPTFVQPLGNKLYHLLGTLLINKKLIMCKCCYVFGYIHVNVKSKAGGLARGGKEIFRSNDSDRY